jgi:hypothetical protein
VGHVTAGWLARRRGHNTKKNLMPPHRQIRGGGCVESGAGPALHIKCTIFHPNVADLDDGQLTVPASRIRQWWVIVVKWWVNIVKWWVRLSALKNNSDKRRSCCIIVKRIRCTEISSQMSIEELLPIVQLGYVICDIEDATLEVKERRDQLGSEAVQLLNDIRMNLEKVEAWLQSLGDCEDSQEVER